MNVFHFWSLKYDFSDPPRQGVVLQLVSKSLALSAFAALVVVGTVCSIVAAFLSPGSVVFTVLTLGAKTLVTAAFTISYLYTAQLFPTSVRATALGACSTMARVGGALAPFLGKYLPELVSLSVFGGVGVLRGLVALLLSDTVGFPLPNTFQDVENIKKNQKQSITDDQK